jgi:hypothetical protein
MKVVERFILSRDFGWKLEADELADAITTLADEAAPSNVYIVIDPSGQYLVNKDYIRVKVSKKED